MRVAEPNWARNRPRRETKEKKTENEFERMFNELTTVIQKNVSATRYDERERR